MEPFRYHAYICTQQKQEGAPSCNNAGAEKVLVSLKNKLAENNLTDQVQVTPCGCLGICEKGPNMVVYPEGHWYSGLTPENVGRIVDEHLLNHAPVDDLLVRDQEATRQEIMEHTKKVAGMKAMMEKAGVIPDELNRFIIGFMESRIMLTAIELDLFSAIGSGATAVEAAGKIGAHPRATEKLMNALTALEIMEKEGDLYKNSPLAAKFLAKGSEFDSRMSSMHAVGLWHSWSTLTDCVKKGTSVNLEKRKERDENATRAFIAAMHKNASFRARQVIRMINLEGVDHVLDLGGGSGAYSIAFVKEKPGIKATIFDLAPVVSLAKNYIAEAGISENVEFVAGDMKEDSLGNGYDLVWISAICHMWGPDENLALMQKVYKALNPGGRIVIQDFILNDEGTAPRMGAVFAMNMLVNTKAGSSYSQKEYIDWLTVAGFAKTESLSLSGPTDLIFSTKST
ncbi:methyltransferase [bacterium]|nr:methyltransferase [bacterium]